MDSAVLLALFVVMRPPYLGGTAAQLRRAVSVPGPSRVARMTILDTSFHAEDHDAITDFRCREAGLAPSVSGASRLAG